MKLEARKIASFWTRLGPRFMPFADAASPEFPFGRMVRLSLFQVSIGIALVLLNGTLNRVMIIEFGLSATLVAFMLALPVLIAPIRALLGHRSDNHRSFLGWRRVPYIWMGTLMQFGGLAILPFALIVESGDADGPIVVGHLAAALAFLLIGAGLHTTQTAGLALATDLAPPDKCHRVIAALYVMLLVGMTCSGIAFGELLEPFSPVRLIQVVQGAGVVSLLLNICALWKQEARQPHLTRVDRPRDGFLETWRAFASQRRLLRPLVAVALGTAGFAMQDVLLEPFGAHVLGLSVGSTTLLTALLSGGTLAGLGIAARLLERGGEPYRLAALGALLGIPAFAAVIFSAPLGSVWLYRAGAALIGVGGGIFTITTLTAAMRAAGSSETGLAIGAWGTAQASAAGLSIAVSGLIRDGAASLLQNGAFGPALAQPQTGYLVVYHIEILLLFLCLAAIGPLVRWRPDVNGTAQERFGMAEVPG